jgi:predicted type IV restriction endonuclease
VDLATTIDRIKQAVAGRRPQSEAQVRQSAVLPILRGLGWDDLDPERVTPEFELGGRRVDFALSALPGQPSLFIEVKGPGSVAGVEKQLFEYAFHVGIPFAVLTNGQEWHFFLPGARGSYDERLLYKLDLTERQTAEVVERLWRYVGFERVRSGQALKDAYKDYDDLHSKRLARDALPEAWTQLLAEPDELLVDIVAERAASLCGYRPQPDLVAEFLASNIPSPRGRTPTTKRVPEMRATLPNVPPEPASGTHSLLGHRPEIGGNELRYTFLGAHQTARSGNDVLLYVVRTLAGKDATFLERFAREAPGRKRNHVARRIEDVYPGQPQLAKYVVELAPGWYMGTNISNRDKHRLLQAACKVANLRFGTDMVVQLPNTTA